MSTYNEKTTAVAAACKIDLGTANRLLIEVGHVQHLAIQRFHELEQKKKQSPAPKKSPAPNIKKAKTTKGQPKLTAVKKKTPMSFFRSPPKDAEVISLVNEDEDNDEYKDDDDDDDD